MTDVPGPCKPECRTGELGDNNQHLAGDLDRSGRAILVRPLVEFGHKDLEVVLHDLGVEVERGRHVWGLLGCQWK